MKKLILGIILFLILLTNIPIIDKMVISSIDGQDQFRYSNIDGSITMIQRFGFKDSYFSPNSFDHLVTNGEFTKEQLKMYRLYKINPLCFWRWSFYIFSGSKFKYKDWSEIESVRGKTSRFHEF